MKYLIEEALIDYFGKRCKEYEKGCVVCEVWKEYDKLKQGRQEVLAEVIKKIDFGLDAIRGFNNKSKTIKQTEIYLYALAELSSLKQWIKNLK